jgi:hypothetical protein
VEIKRIVLCFVADLFSRTDNLEKIDDENMAVLDKKTKIVNAIFCLSMGGVLLYVYTKKGYADMLKALLVNKDFHIGLYLNALVLLTFTIMIISSIREMFFPHIYYDVCVLDEHKLKFLGARYYITYINGKIYRLRTRKRLFFINDNLSMFENKNSIHDIEFFSVTGKIIEKIIK